MTSTESDTFEMKPIAIPGIVFIIGLILSIFAFLQVMSIENSKLQRLFQTSSHNHLSTLQTDILRHQDLVNSIARLFSSSSNITRKEFRVFAQDALSRQSSIQALSWVPLIKQHQVNEYTLQAQQAGFDNFGISQMNSRNDVISATTKNEYMPVYYIEPYKGNEKAMGFDLSSNPARLSAISKARDTGSTIITERIKLVQEKKDLYGYLLIKAIYLKGKSLDTLEQRRENFIGLATGVFRFEELLTSSMLKISPVNMDILMLDTSASTDKQFLHFQSSGTLKEPVSSETLPSLMLNDDLHWKATINVLGREWSILYIATDSLLETRDTWHAWLTLLSGLIITSLISLYIFSNNNHVTGMAISNSRLKQEIAEHKSQRNFTDTVLNAASDVIVVLDLNGNIVRFNRTAEEITGFSSADLLGKPIWDWLIPEDQIEGVKNVFNNLRSGKIEIARQYENEWLTRDNGKRLFQWHNSLLYNENGEVSHIVAMGFDITEKKKIELEHERLQIELQQAQKMESLGQLTGGIAHDFNNLLGIINGYASLIHERCLQANDEKGINFSSQINDAGERAAKLVSQMLTFSRNDNQEDLPVQFTVLLKENIEMLRASLPSSIDIKTEIEPELPYVTMNSINFHQILMNLSINARDAMQGIGLITIKLSLTRNLDTQSQTSGAPIKGDWVELSVSDTGSGIDTAIMEHVFEPFFTTKDVGKGTGMGLSVIYGIMHSHDGHIIVESKVGKGTTFRMLFPPLEFNRKINTHAKPGHIELPKNNNEKILVVDDEASLANLMAELLTKYGYDACAITDSEKALELFRRDPDYFSMLITDFTMPKLTGEKLIEMVRDIRPNLPVILCSGHSDNFDIEIAAKKNITYFEKPVNSRNILFKISELLLHENKAIH